MYNILTNINVLNNILFNSNYSHCHFMVKVVYSCSVFWMKPSLIFSLQHVFLVCDGLSCVVLHPQLLSFFCSSLIGSISNSDLMPSLHFWFLKRGYVLKTPFQLFAFVWFYFMFFSVFNLSLFFSCWLSVN